jgi:hypothetical protein
MPGDLSKQIGIIVTAFATEFQRKADDWATARNPADFLAMECAVAALGRQLSDVVTAAILQAIVSDPDFQAEVTAAAYCGLVSYRSGGRREVAVTLLGGSSTRVKVNYLKLERRQQPGRKRKRRGKGGSGLYPALAALGIWYGASPALADEVAFQVCLNDAVRPARAALARRGIDLGHKKTLNLVNQVGRRAKVQRNQWLAEARQRPAVVGGLLAGLKVVVTTDGGRVRLRQVKRGRRRKSGYHSYNTPWREPKLLAIYVIGSDGKVCHKFQPIYDGTLGDADAVFEMLVGYLRALGAHQAAQLVLIGDGAHWIWNRATRLCQQVGVPPERLTQIIDWYHAVEHLHSIAAIPAKWSKKQQLKWVRKAKGYLWKGQIEQLVADIDNLAVGRRAKAVKEHRDYFADNENRMQYKTFSAEGLPTGSGIIESAIRRIVNMRLKSPGKFWDSENAECMILLRSYLKAGRWHSLIYWSLASAVPWWKPARNNRISPLHLQKTSLQENAATSTCYA